MDSWEEEEDGGIRTGHEGTLAVMYWLVLLTVGMIS